MLDLLTAVVSRVNVVYDFPYLKSGHRKRCSNTWKVAHCLIAYSYGLACGARLLALCDKN